MSPHLRVGGVPHAGDEALRHLEGRLPLLLISFSPWTTGRRVLKRSGTLSSPHALFLEEIAGAPSIAGR